MGKIIFLIAVPLLSSLVFDLAYKFSYLFILVLLADTKFVY